MSKIKHEKQSQFEDLWRRLIKNRPALVGLIFIIILILVAIFADVIADYDTKAIQQHPQLRFQPPSSEYFFGTDAFGRDLFARVIHGSRYSLFFGVGCSAIILFFGSLIGGTVAFFGGKIDNIVMRVLDAFMCIPSILMGISLVSVLGLGIKNIMLAIIITAIPANARMVRALVLSIVQQEYIEAAKLSGASNLRIIIYHILPNAIGPIIINTMMGIAGLIIAAASLSYIGMGIQPPIPEWGSMLNEGNQYIRLYPYIMIFPGVAILLTALSFNLLGDGLADALDPRLKD